MGEVYAAYDPELDRKVALKLLRTAGGSAPAKKRLLREARALGKLSHPNVVQIHDVGEHEGDVFLAMELVEGQSLKDWCKSDPPPSFQAVLAAYLDVARGLEAAHQKGLVHRDIKPANLLRGHDGRVRVADFGLAAASGEDDTPPLPASLEGALGERLTATGAIMGTPIYMAPEQFLQAKPSPASDQYSLCVALYESLYGVLPFSADADADPLSVLLQLYERKTKEEPARPPPGTPVPVWVHRALVRGLAPLPEDRHPSMEALVAALRDDPGARRRALLVTLGVATSVAALVTVAAVGWAKSGAFQDPCAHPEQQLAGIWDDDIKGRVKAAFMGTGRAHAEGTVPRVFALLDRQAEAWSTMRGQVCAALRADPSRRRILGLRDECLDRRRGQLQALTTLFAEKPDAEVLDKAVEAAMGLFPVSYCADTQALAARVRPPEDPAVRRRVEAAEATVDRLEALYAAGRYKAGAALATPLLAEAAAIPYPPLRARVQLWAGRLGNVTGDYEGAKARLEEAIDSAAEGSDDVLAANAWAELLLVVGDHQRNLGEAAQLRRWGRVAVTRAHDAQAEAAWLDSEGVLLHRSGDWPAARATLERAVAHWEKVLGPDHPEVAGSLNKLGNASIRLGDYAAARTTHERALAIREKALGPDHPIVAQSLNNLGLVLLTAGDYPRARAVLERALAIREKALGPDHPSLAYPLANLGRVLVKTGELDAAQGRLERALAVREKALGPSHPDLAVPLLGLGELRLAQKKPDEAIPLLERALALDYKEFTLEIQLTLAEALWAVGKDRPRALSLAEDARTRYEHIGHRPGLERATRFLAEHPREGGTR